MKAPSRLRAAPGCCGTKPPKLKINVSSLSQLASQAAQVCLVAHRGSILLAQNRQAWNSVSSLSQLACGKQLKFALSPNGAPFCCAKPPNLAPICHPEWSEAEPKFCGSRALPERAKPRERSSPKARWSDRRDLLRMPNSFLDRCCIHCAAQKK